MGTFAGVDKSEVPLPGLLDFLVKSCILSTYLFTIFLNLESVQTRHATRLQSGNFIHRMRVHATRRVRSHL